MKLFFLIVLAAILVLVQFIFVREISFFGIRPNLILVFLVSIIPFITNISQNTAAFSFLNKQNYTNLIFGKWKRFFLIVAISGALFDILNIERQNGFYFAVFLIVGVFIYFFFWKIPIKNIFFLSSIAIVFSTSIFNLIASLNINYIFSRNNFLETIYNVLLVVLFLIISRLNKLFKSLRF